MSVLCKVLERGLGLLESVFLKLSTKVYVGKTTTRVVSIKSNK